MSVLYRNSRIFTANPDPDLLWAEAFIVEGPTVTWTGSDLSGIEADVTVDLGGRLVMPGFVDSHTHLLMMGAALGQVALLDASSLEEIQARLRSARAADPAATVLRGRGWLFDAVPEGQPTAAMIDDAVADVPVYLDANDYHSCWVNSAALAELGIISETPDPLGGRIVRDAHGQATGLLLETAAIEYAWARRDATTTDIDRDGGLDRAIDAYLRAGVTSVVDMAFDDYGLAAVQRAEKRHGGELPLRVSAHWLVVNTGDDAANLAQLDRAVTLMQETSTSTAARVVGIKLIVDGVIDACTAAMREPYANGAMASPIWPPEQLRTVVEAADERGLQVAMHAIGDLASSIALDSIESAIARNGDIPRRHRIEHLEYAASGTAERMAALQVTASMQPVHADPAVFANWAAMLADHRVDRSFPWTEYENAGALLAFSTDAPTAPHEALANMYVATTRASALNPDLPPAHPEFAVSLDRAIAHATRDGAQSVGDGGWRGQIAPGFAADFVVLDIDPFERGTHALLTAKVIRTFVAGRERFRDG